MARRALARLAAAARRALSRRGTPVRRRAFAALSLLALLVAAAWGGARLPVCPELAEPTPTLVVRDRGAQLVARVRGASAESYEPIALEELPEGVVPLLLAAEDKRFFLHPGVDPIAIVRALVQAAWNGRVISGGSTLTQQLVRQTCHRPRTLVGKLHEMALALKLEAAWSKRQILEAYLNRVSFGPLVRGIGAASRHYFDKPASALGLAEAATLVAIVRGPSLYDPRRALEPVERRRARLLDRLQALGALPDEVVQRAREAPIVLRRAYVAPGAHHFVRSLVNGRLEAAGLVAAAPPSSAFAELSTTLDVELQRQVEAAVASAAATWGSRRASAAAVVVVDNERSELLAYVGSPDYDAAAALGQNDGALALRQPGSALKPFVYALALEELGLHASSVLPDLELFLPGADGGFAPRNYDGRFHGPVRLAAALGSSLNVPAVHLAARLGSERVLSFLHALGFRSLDEDAAHYGPALALGSGEVRLVELAAAYAALARGGLYRPLRVQPGADAPETRVMSAGVAAQIGDILADPRARAAGFGRDGVLELDFWAAVKTGTSKGYRDNVAVGYTPRVTVAVWVGNFDGTPMVASSGVSGAGPLYAAVMQAAARRYPSAAPRLTPERVAVCSLSGLVAGPHCPHTLEQPFFTRSRPTERCTWHEVLDGDARDEESSALGCTGAGRCVVERLPLEYHAWARQHRRARVAAPRASPVAASRPAIVFPTPGARFLIDPRLPREQQAIVLSARASGGPLTFELDGRKLATVDPPYTLPWLLREGDYQLSVRDARGRSARVSFSVR